MKFLVRLVIVVVTSAARSRAESTAHRCLPGTEAFVCTLPFFDYDPEQNIPQFHLPNDTKAIRFVRPFYNLNDLPDCIGTYDAVLHKQLGFPEAVQIKDTCTHTIEMPPSLVYADFSGNYIKAIIAPTEQSYALRFLNLNHNGRLKDSNVGNISKFVNLETLDLSDTSLESFPKGFFVNLNRLAHLTLNNNMFARIDLPALPPSLVTLRLDGNGIEQLHFPSGRFPLLEDLNVEFNQVRAVNVGELLAMAPRLRLFALGHNAIKRDKLSVIMDELTRRNVSYYNTELPSDAECLSGERRFRGACVPENSFPMELGEWLEIVALVCLLVAVLIGGVFGGVKLWSKWRPM